jgi:hypothetical protein
MSATPETLLDDQTLAELFALADDPAGRAQLQDMYREFYADAAQACAALTAAEAATDRRARLHKLKGMMANYGFAGCAARLAGWEKTSAPADAAESLRLLFVQSRRELAERHPWLEGEAKPET